MTPVVELSNGKTVSFRGDIIIDRRDGRVDIQTTDTDAKAEIEKPVQPGTMVTRIAADENGRVNGAPKINITDYLPLGKITS